jgi:hypothetical protein
MLTDQQIKLIQPPTTGRKSYTDRNGLCLRVTANNHKSWSIQYRNNGRKCRYTLGKYPLISLADARRLTILKLREIIYDDIQDARGKTKGSA